MIAERDHLVRHGQTPSPEQEAAHCHHTYQGPVTGHQWQTKWPNNRTLWHPIFHVSSCRYQILDYHRMSFH